MSCMKAWLKYQWRTRERTTVTWKAHPSHRERTSKDHNILRWSMLSPNQTLMNRSTQSSQWWRLTRTQIQMFNLASSCRKICRNGVSKIDSLEGHRQAVLRLEDSKSTATFNLSNRIRWPQMTSDQVYFGSRNYGTLYILPVKRDQLNW